MSNQEFFNVRDLVIRPDLHDDLILRWLPQRPTVRILVVADTSVTFTTSFGLGMVIDLIRANADSYVNFEVDLARLGTEGSSLSINASPTGHEPKYTNFRFSSEVSGNPVLDDYDQVWCFGFAPGNNGLPDDDFIWNSAYRSSQQDLEVLTQWMNAGGGVLAMGDHHYLGAAMCAEIPRVRSMRRWTNAQGVPPIGGTGRLDTNRPMNASQDPAFDPTPSMIPFDAQSDGVPQEIEWRRYWAGSYYPHPYLARRYRPHPILCGGSLGVLDLLPDHPHEGWVYEDAEIDTNATYDVGDLSGDEYPTVGGVQPTPEVIAWGHTLADPPHNHQKGNSPAKRFGVIGAYDGSLADVGRVIVDSTWHHWMDVNLFGLAAESPDTEYQKIVRYFRNCAVWLSRASQRQAMISYSSFWAIYHAQAFEDFHLSDVWYLGRTAFDVLGRATSDCLVSDWIIAWIDPIVIDRLRKPFPFPDPCWSCPPFELLQQAVLGGIVQKILPLRARVLEAAECGEDPKVTQDEIKKGIEAGAAEGMAAFQKAVRANMEPLEAFAKLDLNVRSAC